ncbi:hypothetical protein ACQUY5_30275 [Bacillus cereus]|uniref:hypothetical protein n=1 Tax=Bacillus cereus TaxID=1396 RepID=UPI003D17C3D9
MGLNSGFYVLDNKELEKEGRLHYKTKAKGKYDFWGNAVIYQWFIREVMDSKPSMDYFKVNKEMVQELRDTCVRVLDNPDLGYTELPINDEWRGRCYQNDERYFEYLESTIEWLDFILEHHDFERETLYYSADW